jgi:hypothetical protein
MCFHWDSKITRPENALLAVLLEWCVKKKSSVQWPWNVGGFMLSLTQCHDKHIRGLKFALGITTTEPSIC